MEFYEQVLKSNKEDLENLWIEIQNNCETVQKNVLKSIIDLSKDTLFGVEHDFSNINSVEDFRENVPVSDYDDYEFYINKLAHGEMDVLYPSVTDYFILTSGTSSGKSKLIPENQRAKDAKNAVYSLRNYYIYKLFIKSFSNNPHFIGFVKDKLGDKFSPNFKLTDLLSSIHFLSFSSKTPDYTTDAGIPISFASGMSFENSEFSNMISYPKELMSVSDNEISNYLINLFSLRFDDIVYLTTNNAVHFVNKVLYAQEHAEELIYDLYHGTISDRLDLSCEDRVLFESLMEPCPERARELDLLLNKGKEFFIPKYYWPNIFICKFWLGGSVGFNAESARKLLPDDTLFFDVGYGSSESKINIPFKTNTPCGVLASFTCFYEFLSEDTGDILSAWELQDGCVYELLLTNYAGLYRYPLHDLVKVCGFTGNTPNLFFLSKSGEILNMEQEKIPASEFVKSLHLNSSFNVNMVQIYQNINSKSYDVFIEVDEDCDLDLNDFSKELDEVIMDDFPIYARRRKLNVLNQLKVHLMSPGWSESLYESYQRVGTPKSQIKIPIIVGEFPRNDYFLIK